MILLPSIPTSPEIHLQMSGEYCNKVSKTIVSVEIINVIIMVCLVGHPAEAPASFFVHFRWFEERHRRALSEICELEF